MAKPKLTSTPFSKSGLNFLECSCGHSSIVYKKTTAFCEDSKNCSFARQQNRKTKVKPVQESL